MIGDIGRAGLTEVEAYRIVPKRRRVAAISDLARERRWGSIVRHWERAQRRLPMAHDTRITSGLTSIVASVALGAIAMYAFDPDKGRRRRALARDKAVSVLLDTRHAAGATRRDVTHRLLGLRARAKRLLRRQPTTDDLQLIERVRARMGRLVSHPHAIQVGALGGRVTLSGPILAHEATPLLAAVGTVWGVGSVENLLVVHDHPESIPSLQGGVDPLASAPHEHWPPALRAAALSSGVLMALYGLRQRSLAGCAIACVGAGLAARGITNRSLARLASTLSDAAGAGQPGSVDEATPIASADTASAEAAGEDTAARRALH